MGGSRLYEGGKWEEGRNEGVGWRKEEWIMRRGGAKNNEKWEENNNERGNDEKGRKDEEWRTLEGQKNWKKRRGR